MGHLNVLKGQANCTKQNDRALQITGVDQDSITRGSVLVEDSGRFRLAKSTDKGKIPYFALQQAGDPDVAMAGNVITGLAGTADLVLETDQYDGSLIAGDKLVLGNNGKVTKAKAPVGDVPGDTAIVGVVLEAPTRRWSNNAQVKVAGQYGQRTGGPITCIKFQTTFVVG